MSLPVKGLVAYFPLDGDAKDHSDYGHVGRVSGTTPAEDRFGNASGAFRFNGVDDFIEVGPSPGLNTYKMDVISFSLWGYIENYRFNNRMLTLSSSDDGFSLDLTAQNKRLVFKNHTGWLKEDAMALSDVVELNQWQHIVVMMNFPLKSCFMYINGKLADISTGKSSVRPVQPVLTIGNNPSSKGWRSFEGRLDDIRVYNRELFEWEILALHREKGYGGEPVPVTYHHIFNHENLGYHGQVASTNWRNF
jgi:hypothetical protein